MNKYAKFLIFAPMNKHAYIIGAKVHIRENKKFYYISSYERKFIGAKMRCFCRFVHRSESAYERKDNIFGDLFIGAKVHRRESAYERMFILAKVHKCESSYLRKCIRAKVHTCEFAAMNIRTYDFRTYDIAPKIRF